MIASTPSLTREVIRSLRSGKLAATKTGPAPYAHLRKELSYVAEIKIASVKIQKRVPAQRPFHVDPFVHASKRPVFSLLVRNVKAVVGKRVYFSAVFWFREDLLLILFLITQSI